MTRVPITIGRAASSAHPVANGLHRSRGNLLLFCSTPADVQWPELNNFSNEIREDVALLLNAIAVESAVHWSASLGMHAVIHTTAASPMEGLMPLPDSIHLVAQQKLPLHKRFAEALRLSGENRDGSATTLILGNNPLYPIAALQQGVELLGQEDEVVVFGEGHQRDGAQCLMWVAMKSHHPEIVEHLEQPAEQGLDFMRIIADTHGLVMVMKPVREIGGMNDLSYLLHEIERALLLKQWYPSRTYEVLMRLQNHGAIPEVHR